MHRFVCLTVLTLMIGGCSSIAGRKVVTASSGDVTTVDVGGLPIVVKHPTMAAFLVTETTYAVTRTAIAPDGTIGHSEPLADATDVTIDPEPILLGPHSVYTIDPQRPAYGTLDYTIQFDNQYPTSINSKIDDKTLGEIRALVEKVLETYAPVPTIEKQAGQLIERTVREQRKRVLVFHLESGQIEVVDPQ